VAGPGASLRAAARIAARSLFRIRPYNVAVAAPPTGDDWIELLATPLPTESAVTWATTPTAGAVVSFLGVVRDHAEGRTGVVGLDYEAYEEEAVRVLGQIAAEARRRWPEVERLALLHRTGHLALSEPSVAVVVSSPHRADAFEAARWCIDTLKESAPIWKREHWSDGSDWSPAEQPIRPVVEPTRSRA
jgi:molybdopterin synthase catalytic subunit